MRFDNLTALLRDPTASVEARCGAARDLAAMGDPRCDVMLELLAETTDRQLRFELSTTRSAPRCACVRCVRRDHSGSR